MAERSDEDEDDLDHILSTAQKHFKEGDLEKAAELWRAGCVQQDSTCLYNYACCLQRGWGVATKDPVQAVAKFRDAAQLDHPGALYNLAWCHIHGIGTYKDVKEAVTLLKQASRLGHVEASFNVGQLLLHPSKWLNTSGTSGTQRKAGSSNSKGKSGAGKLSPGQIQAAYAEAISFLKIASDNGLPDASYSLALCYMKGGPGMAPDEELGFQHFERAAQFGCVDAMFHVAQCYELGQGTPPCVPKVIYFYKQAASLGHIEALFRLGICYQNGIGAMLPCQKLAHQYFRRAADKGHVPAMVQLAICLESGSGVERNMSEALFWYSRATKNSDASAISPLAVLRLGRLRYRQELVEAVIACVQEDIRDDLVEVQREVEVEPAVVASLTVRPRSGRPKSGSTTGTRGSRGSFRSRRTEKMNMARRISSRQSMRGAQRSTRLPAATGNSTSSSSSSSLAPSSSFSRGRSLAKTVAKPSGLKMSRVTKAHRSNSDRSLALDAFRETAKELKSDADLGTRPSAEMIGELVGDVSHLRTLLGQAASNITHHQLSALQRGLLNLTIPTAATTQLLTSAFEMWTKISDQDPDNAAAFYYVGLCHELGAGTPLNTALAQQYYQRSSEKDPSFAPALFAEAMAVIRSQSPVSEEQRLEMINNAAQPQSTARKVRAQNHPLGISVGLAYERAAQLLWRAWLAQNHTDALFNLGVLYENGFIQVEVVRPPAEFMAAFSKPDKKIVLTPAE